MCLSTSKAFVCFVKLFALTTFLALSSVSPPSLTTTFLGFFFIAPLLSFVMSMPTPVLRSFCSSSNSDMLMLLSRVLLRVENGIHSLQVFLSARLPSFTIGWIFTLWGDLTDSRLWTRTLLDHEELALSATVTLHGVRRAFPAQWPGLDRTARTPM